ncbi:hypothetical protein DIP35_01515 [Neisseria gonorrhoeae]
MVIQKYSGLTKIRTRRNARTVIPATFRHSRESGNLGRRVKKTYIPSFPQKQKTKIRNLKSRHSRAGGNLESRTFR